MVKTWMLGLVVASVLLAGVWWLFGGDRDLRKITRQSERLAAALHKSQDDGLLGLANRSREIADFFAKKVALTPGEPLPSIQSRDEIVTIAATTLHAVSRLEVTILDRDLNWVEPHQQAAMRVAVEVIAEGRGERQKLLHTYDLTWINEEDRWVISSAQISESIRRPATSGR
ncbi:MAG: hypothetical protein NTY53_17520 [Kiritimatiellaeota bacterium]|nr:hypothetical protein [Kiritimatiellota bacterium]